MWRYTPRELHLLIDAYNERIYRREDREAVWVANLLNATGHLKTAARPEELLGRPLRSQKGRGE